MNSENARTSARVDRLVRHLDVWLVLVLHPSTGEWTRVGPVYRQKHVAASWRRFVKSAWHGAATRVKHERIPHIGKTTTTKVKAKFRERYAIDIE